MKEKILARFKAKYPAVNLSTKRLDALSARLESKITDESEIDAQLDAINDFTPFDEIAKSDDTIISLKAKLKTAGKPAPKDVDDTTDQPQDVPKPDDMPAWAKTLLNEVQTLKKDKAQQTIQEKLKGNDKLKGIPQQFYKGRPLPEKDEDIETFVNEVESDFTAFKEAFSGVQQDHINQAFAGSSKPAASAGGGTGKADPAIAAYAAKKAQAAQIK